MARNSMSKAPSWIGPVTVVALVLGFLLVSAGKSSDFERPSLYSGGNRGGVPTSSPNIGGPIDEREAEIRRLRQQVTMLEESMSDNSRQTKILNDNLQEVKMFAGLTEIEGPGIEIILRDSTKKSDDPFLTSEYVIHDTDLLRVVNELWMSGAEAIVINKQRLARNTNFRCEGPVIYVGRVPISSPVTIRAVGDPETLYGAMTMQGRYLDAIKSGDEAMVQVTKKDKLQLPAFTGSTEFNHAKTAPKQ